jgi:capsular polysaccharide biosynthesis protein
MHAPTIAYYLKNAILFDGCIYLKHFKYPVSERSLFKSARRNCDLERVALASSFLGTKYFGHWLIDDTTRYLLAQDASLPLCVRMPTYGHRAAYEKYFNQDWTPIDRAHINDLVIFQDYSQNSSKTKRYKILRERLKRHFNNAGDRDYIYLRRGQSGVSRTIANEPEILEVLTKQGFQIVNVASDKLEDIITALLGARIVISIEGSHIAHCTLAVPERSGLLVLEPPGRFSGVHRAQAGSLGIKFGFVVGLPSDTGYVFSVSEILKTIDLLLQRIDQVAVL